MRSCNTPTRTITRTVISLSLAGVVLGLTLTAILPAAYGQVINACVNTKTGALRILTSGTCKVGERPISWSNTGPKGDKGDPGTPGTNGLNASAEPCNPDSVKVGTTCVDKYEASVWQTTDLIVIDEIRAGTVTLAELQSYAIQLGLASGDLAARGCLDTGQDVAPFRVNSCKNVYAVSIQGVTPSRYLTWFQAAAAARNAGKRLPTNAEWQAAALGTPDGAPCIVSAAGPGLTGTAGCVSDAGAFDMVGNLWEWVADWGSQATACAPWSTWPAEFGSDYSCIGGDAAGTATLPGALIRGGDWGYGSLAGVFAVDGSINPSVAPGDVGFRCAR